MVAIAFGKQYNSASNRSGSVVRWKTIQAIADALSEVQLQLHRIAAAKQLLRQLAIVLNNKRLFLGSIKRQLSPLRP